MGKYENTESKFSVKLPSPSLPPALRDCSVIKTVPQTQQNKTMRTSAVLLLTFIFAASSNSILRNYSRQVNIYWREDKLQIALIFSLPASFQHRSSIATSFHSRQARNPALGAPFTNYLLSKQFPRVKPFINLKASEPQPFTPTQTIGRSFAATQVSDEASEKSFSFDLHPEEKLSKIVNNNKD